MRIRGTQETVKPIEVNVDTVYIRTNITKIEEEDFDGWEYDEVQYDKNEFIETLTRQEDSGMLALIVSMLMSEVDMLKSMIGVINMNEMFLNMYVIAVETGRLTIDFIPSLYKMEVARILGIELDED